MSVFEQLGKDLRPLLRGWDVEDSMPRRRHVFQEAGRRLGVSDSEVARLWEGNNGADSVRNMWYPSDVVKWSVRLLFPDYPTRTDVGRSGLTELEAVAQAVSATMNGYYEPERQRFSALGEVAYEPLSRWWNVSPVLASRGAVDVMAEQLGIPPKDRFPVFDELALEAPGPDQLAERAIEGLARREFESNWLDPADATIVVPGALERYRAAAARSEPGRTTTPQGVDEREPDGHSH
jgi:hypothetical protein